MKVARSHNSVLIPAISLATARRWQIIAFVYWMFAHVVGVWFETRVRERLVDAIRRLERQEVPSAGVIAERLSDPTNFTFLGRVGYGLLRSLDDVEVWIIGGVVLASSQVAAASRRVPVQQLARLDRLIAVRSHAILACTIGALIVYVLWTYETDGTLFNAWAGVPQVRVCGKSIAAPDRKWGKVPLEFLKGSLFMVVIGLNAVVVRHALVALRWSRHRFSPSKSKRIVLRHLVAASLQPFVVGQLVFLIAIQLLSTPITPFWSMTPLPEAFGLILIVSAPYLVLFLYILFDHEHNLVFAPIRLRSLLFGR